MRFARKLILALWLGIVLVYGITGVDRYRREAEHFQGDMERDHFVLGRGLGAAVGELWEEQGGARALDILQRANERESDIRIRWVDLDKPETVAAPSPALDEVRAGEPTTWVRPDEPPTLYTYVPLVVGRDQRGAIELSESLAAEETFAHASLVRAVLTFGALAAMSGGVALALGVRFVGRPMRKLVDKARRVGAGDFDGELVLDQDDELGELAREMNLMSQRLADSRARADAEAQARVTVVGQLRHADRLLTVGKLASGLAHELGTPLNVVQLRARAIATAEVGGADAQEHARIIGEQAERMTRILRQLLDFARPRPPERRDEDVVALVERSVAILAPLARRGRVEVHVQALARPVQAHVDAMQLQQVFTNLAVNAIQAMPQGGSLEVEVGPAPRGHVRIRFTDTGPGIAPEHLGRVFDPFFTTKEVGEGTGLGLPVAYGIVREHGGWIDVASPPGGGACFDVYLPGTA